MMQRQGRWVRRTPRRAVLNARRQRRRRQRTGPRSFSADPEEDAQVSWPPGRGHQLHLIVFFVWSS